MTESTYKSAFLIIYLGKLPDYLDFWAKSCEPNYERFHWFVYNDQIEKREEINQAVTLIPYDFKSLCAESKDRLDITIPHENTRIVCDCRLILYPLRKEKESLEEFDFIGYTDLDVIYGHIQDFMPENALNYSLISGENNRPCGPFTLFRTDVLKKICSDDQIKTRLEQDPGSQVYSSCEYTEQDAAFKPMSGNTTKDKISQSIKFEHIDESRLLVKLAQKYAPTFCSADPLQPTSTRWFNHRKAVAFFENNRLFVRDNWGHKKEGAFFHFSRFKNRSRFKVNHQVLSEKNWGIYKYGFIPLKSIFTKIKMMLTTLY